MSVPSKDTRVLSLDTTVPSHETSLVSREGGNLLSSDTVHVQGFGSCIPFVLLHCSYESERSEVVPVTALRKTKTEWQNNSTKKNSG